MYATQLSDLKHNFTNAGDLSLTKIGTEKQIMGQTNYDANIVMRSRNHEDFPILFVKTTLTSIFTIL